MDIRVNSTDFHFSLLILSLCFCVRWLWQRNALLSKYLSRCELRPVQTVTFTLVFWHHTAPWLQLKNICIWRTSPSQSHHRVTSQTVLFACDLQWLKNKISGLYEDERRFNVDNCDHLAQTLARRFCLFATWMHWVTHTHTARRHCIFSFIHHKLVPSTLFIFSSWSFGN